MLILDKSRALDLMVAQANRVLIPAEFIAAHEAAPPPGGGFRVAIYGPIEPSAPLRADPAPRSFAPASPVPGAQAQASLAPSA